MSKLYIVPTPIGNLDDITLRAVRVLREVDLILAEDTRTSSVLLRHLGIEKRLHAHHKFNEHATAAVVAETIAAGAPWRCSPTPERRALRPGFWLVRTCVDRGSRSRRARGPRPHSGAGAERIPLRPLLLRGVSPQKKGRNKRLSELADEERTMVFYESPLPRGEVPRAVRGDVRGRTAGVGVARADKKFEQTVRGTAAEVLEHFRRTEPRGEFVLVVAGRPKTGKIHKKESENEENDER